MYGTLKNQQVKLIQYTGKETKTARTIVDNFNQTIAVDVKTDTIATTEQLEAECFLREQSDLRLSEKQTSLQQAIESEESARVAGDQTLQTAVDSEKEIRRDADRQLKNLIDAVSAEVMKSIKTINNIPPDSGRNFTIQTGTNIGAISVGGQDVQVKGITGVNTTSKTTQWNSGQLPQLQYEQVSISSLKTLGTPTNVTIENNTLMISVGTTPTAEQINVNSIDSWDAGQLSTLEQENVQVLTSDE